MKRIITITTIAIACLFALYAYLTWNGGSNPRFMNHLYNKVVTEPLARIGVADAQFKMGLYWFHNIGSEPNKTELENAIYWWEKAAEKGHQDATAELAKTQELLDELNNPLRIEFEGRDYEHGVMYYNRAVKYIAEDNDADALDCTMKALVIFRRLGLEEDSVFINCVNLIPAIEEIAERKYGDDPQNAFE